MVAKPNYNFKLSVKDIKIIEDALRNKVSRRAERMMKGEDVEILQTETKEIMAPTSSILLLTISIA